MKNILILFTVILFVSCNHSKKNNTFLLSDNQKYYKAARFLKGTNLSITEISEVIGFGTQKYFSNSFKRHFGVTPLNYRKN